MFPSDQRLRAADTVALGPRIRGWGYQVLIFLGIGWMMGAAADDMLARGAAEVMFVFLIVLLVDVFFST